MAIQEAIYCDYCGNYIGSTEAYTTQTDPAGNHWCGKCTGSPHADPSDLEEKS